MARRRAFFGAAIAIGLGGLAACATTTAAVEPGHRAVWMDEGGAMRVLDEGAYDLPGTAVVHDFDLRQRAQAKSFGAITADGARLVVRDPEISYSVIPEELIAADREVGPHGAGAIVEPVVAALSARVLATYCWDQLDSAHIREAQDKIVALAGPALRPYHLRLQSIDLKALAPQLPLLAQEVLDTSVWEQRSAQAKTQLELAKQRADHLREQAKGIAAANQGVAPTLTPAVLQDKAGKAWSALVTAPATSVEISESETANVEITP